MKFKPSKKQISEIYSRSKEGLWVKAQIVDSGIELFWQVRTKLINGKLAFYDANGNIESICPVNNARYDAPMRSCGIVPIDDGFVEFCGLEFFDGMVSAVMRHIVNMVTSGYGNDPSEIVEWYSNISDLKFLDGTRFRFNDYCLEPFLDLNGLICEVSSVENETYIANINLRDKIFEIPIDSHKSLISFIISTTPV